MWANVVKKRHIVHIYAQMDAFTFSFKERCYFTTKNLFNFDFGNLLYLYQIRLALPNE